LLSTGSPFVPLNELDAAGLPPVGQSTGQAKDTEKADKKRRGAAGNVVGAAKGVTKSLRAGAEAVVNDLVLVLVGLLTLASALLGAVVIYRSRQHLLR
jgi:hypothetical protein